MTSPVSAAQATASLNRLREIPVADIIAEVRRMRGVTCPTCASLNHHAVDLDGRGEELRCCDDCGINFEVEARIR